MVQKRVLALSLFVLVCTALSVQAFGGGGGGGGGGSSGGGSTYIPVYSFEQGSSVTIAWNAPAEANIPGGDGAIPRAIDGGSAGRASFVSISISVSGPGGTLASWTDTSNTGSKTVPIPRSAAVGTYTVSASAEYDEPDAQGYAKAYEQGSRNSKFIVTSAAREYKPGDTVVASWQMMSGYTEVSDPYNTYSTSYDYHDSQLTVSINDPSGKTVKSCDSGPVTGGSGGACMWTIPSSAAEGKYSISASCPDCESYGAGDSNTGRSDFYVKKDTIPAGTSPGDVCGTGNTCANGLQCQSGTCVQVNVGQGGKCDTYRKCGSSYICTSGTCQPPVVNTPDQAAVGVLDAAYADGHAGGWARDPDYQGAGQYISVHFYIDGSFAGDLVANSPSEPAVGGNGAHRFSWSIPLQYWDGKQHSITAYAIGATTTGSASGNNPSIGTKTFTYQQPANPCTQFTYGAWSACANGQQTRTLTSSSPSGCTGGSPVTTQTCSGLVGNQCTSTAQCSSGLACVSGTCQTSGSCTTDSQCTSGKVCISGVCSTPDTPPCTSSAQCSSGQTCSGGKCVDIVYVGLGGDCSGGKVCQTGLECRNNVCVRQIGGQCTSSAQCGAGRICDLSVGQCRVSTGGQCTSTAQCPNDQICDAGVCAVPIVIEVTSASWSDMANAYISSSDKEDTVKLKASGEHLGGEQVKFTIYKKQTLLDSKVDEKTVTASSDSVETTMKISAAGTYYFKASADSSEKRSGDLVVSDTIINSPPVAVISTPSEGSIYFTGNPVSFTHASYDVDDTIVSDSWKFGDANTGTGKSATNTYASSGSKTITLEVTDSRGAKASQKRNIILANPTGYTIFVGIEKPLAQEAVKNNNLIVEYSGRSTYVINTTTTGSPCTVTVSCVQGQCPSSTSASPNCASSSSAPVPVNGGQKGYEQLSFNWSFKEGTSFLSSEAGTGKVSGTKGFSDYGQKNITLTVRYLGESNLKASLTREFILLNQRQCSASGTTWYKISNGFITENRDTLGTIACAGLDLQAGTNDDCCPLGFICTTSGTPGCKLDESAELGCSSYTAQSACSTDASQRVRNEALWEHYNCGSSINGQNVLCSCSWNVQRNLCEFGRNTRPEGNPVSGTTTACTYTTTTDQCVNGYQNVQIKASGNTQADPLCSDSTQILPCGRPVVALPFLGGVQIVAIVLAVIVVYLILHRLNSKGKKRRKR